MPLSSASPSFLSRVVAADAVISGTTGLALAVFAGPLESVLGLPAALLRGAGLALLPFAAVVLGIARRDPVPAGGVKGIMAANVVWVAASALLLVSGWVSPTALGTAFVVAQAVAVVGLTELEFFALRRTPAAA